MIDLRSDTVTVPTPEMRQAMANAIVGDDVYEDDPTTKELEALAAAIVGKEAALFMPSGTMANQIAIMTHTNHGDEVIASSKSHIVMYEVGASAVLSGVSFRLTDIHVTKDFIHDSVRPDDIHMPKTGLICLENPLCDGTVVSDYFMEPAYQAAKAFNIPVHLDGARLFNGAVFLKKDPKELAQYCDSVMFCLSKGLCAPVGSMLCGSAEFIARARKYRKMLGGGMRQVGILAAAGIIALNTMTKRLKEDHENALYLAEELTKIPVLYVTIDLVDINMVFFFFEVSVNDEDFVEYMLENGVKINDKHGGFYRFVTHNDIKKADIDKTVNQIKEYIKIYG